MFFIQPPKHIEEQWLVMAKDIVEKTTGLDADSISVNLVRDTCVVGHGLTIYVQKLVDSKRDNSLLVCEFTLAEMPGCCGMGVSTGTYVSPEYRMKGLATALHELKDEIAVSLGLAALVCTIVDDQEAQHKVLTRNNWERTAKFNSIFKTGNPISVWLKKYDGVA